MTEGEVSREEMGKLGDEGGNSFSERRSPMRCLRCHGTMVNEWIFTENERGSLMTRCVNCGDLIDPVVISNRVHSSVNFLKTRKGQLDVAGRYEVVNSAVFEDLWVS
jgi:hypothetical protein